MDLDFRFIIAGSLIILALIPLYIYRKRIYQKLFKPEGDINSFVKTLNEYLIKYHPRIEFNYDIVDKLVDEKDFKVKQILIIEDLVNQFAYYEYTLKTQKGIDSDKLWTGYEQNSKLIKDNNLPKDWAQRKRSAWVRDNGKCNRCGTKISLEDSNALLAKQMKDGGGFNLENIVILCNDCTRVVKSSNLESTKKDLLLLDELMKKTTY